MIVTLGRMIEPGQTHLKELPGLPMTDHRLWKDRGLHALPGILIGLRIPGSVRQSNQAIHAMTDLTEGMNSAGPIQIHI